MWAVWRLVTSRTAGRPACLAASNTALAYLQANYPATFVAFLDDDDAWDPSYLRKCERAALDRDLDMVAAGLIYRASGDSDGVLLDPPTELDSDELLVRNTHIQGFQHVCQAEQITGGRRFRRGNGKHHRPGRLHQTRRLGHGQVRRLAGASGGSLRGQRPASPLHSWIGQERIGVEVFLQKVSAAGCPQINGRRSSSAAVGCSTATRQSMIRHRHALRALRSSE